MLGGHAEVLLYGLAAVPDGPCQSCPSAIKICSTGMMAVLQTGAELTLLAYEPCWRTAAGTGEDMGFLYWSRADQRLNERKDKRRQ
ncbi:MAG: hypothetical protein ABIW31_01625 [Novosphingobium sp.]